MISLLCWALTSSWAVTVPWVQVAGGEQVRGLARRVFGTADGLAVDGEVAQADPAGGGFLAQPGAQRGVGLAGVDAGDRALDGLQAGRTAAAGGRAGAQPAAGQGLLRHRRGELADRVDGVRAAQLRDRDHDEDRFQGVALAAGLAVVGDLAQVLQQAAAAATVAAVNVHGVQVGPAFITAGCDRGGIERPGQQARQAGGSGAEAAQPVLLPGAP